MNAAGGRVYSIIARGSQTKKRRCSSCLRDCTPQRGHTRLAAPQQRQQHTWLQAPRNGVSGGQEHAAQRSTAAAAQRGVSTQQSARGMRIAPVGCDDVPRSTDATASLSCGAPAAAPVRQSGGQQRQRRVQDTASGAGVASGAERTRAPRLKRLSGGRSSASAPGRSRRRPGSSATTA